MKKIQTSTVARTIISRKNHSHKGDYGRILCIGGHAKMGGAIMMAAKAAVYSGAGLVTVATDASNKAGLQSQLSEAMWVDLYHLEELLSLLHQMDVILIGPGLSRGAEEEAILLSVLQAAYPSQILIIDGDALSLLAKNPLPLQTCQAQLVLTPHAGEWERLSQLTIDASNDRHQQVAQNLHSHLVLKGAPSRLFYDQNIWENTTGSPAQATGGMGDTLAGMLAAFAGQFSPLEEALASAHFLHSYIADQLAQEAYVVLPSQITQAIPRYMKEFEKMEVN